MSSFDAENKQINVFDFRGPCLSKQYFDQDPLFNELEKYYNRENYQFEVPDEKLSDVTELLEEFFYKPEIVHRPDEYCVATEETKSEDKKCSSHTAS